MMHGQKNIKPCIMFYVTFHLPIVNAVKK